MRVMNHITFGFCVYLIASFLYHIAACPTLNCSSTSVGGSCRPSDQLVDTRDSAAAAEPTLEPEVSLTLATSEWHALLLPASVDIAAGILHALSARLLPAHSSAASGADHLLPPAFLIDTDRDRGA